MITFFLKKNIIKQILISIFTEIKKNEKNNLIHFCDPQTKSNLNSLKNQIWNKHLFLLCK